MTFPTIEDMQRKYPKLVKVGKVTGTVRLYGRARDELREFVWNREGGRCQDCDAFVTVDKGYWSSMHLAHIKSVGSGGSDTPDNCKCKCLGCHMREHTEGAVATGQEATL